MKQPKYKIDDKLTYTYEDNNELRLLPVTIKSVCIEKEEVIYWPYEYCVDMNEQDLYTEDELIKLVKEFIYQPVKESR